jgi:acyl-CoA synthetase (AMP-forming)/AMP-acid ligase II
LRRQARSGTYSWNPAPTEDELHLYCRQHLAPYKTPQQWVFVDAFPLTASGKIQKFRLRESLLNTTASG